MRSARSGDRQERETAEDLPLVRHSMGDPAPDAGHGPLPAVGHDAGRSGAAGKRGERHGRGPSYAGRQAGTVCRVPAAEERMKTAVEMTGHGRRGKPKAGFPPTPTALGNRCTISTFPPPRRAMEKWETRNRFPTF